MENTNLENLCKALEENRSKKFTTFIWLLVTFIVLFITGGLLTYFVGYRNDNSVVLIIGFALVIISIIILIVGICVRSSYIKSAYASLEDIAINKYFPGYTKNSNYGFDLGYLLKPGFFAYPDRYYKSNYLKASYKGINFEKAAYDLQKEHKSTDSKGNTTVTYQTYAKGTMYVFDFEREFGEIVKVLEKEGVLSFGMSKDNLTKVETEFINFNKKFRVLCSNENTVFYILTPQVQEEILELEKKYSGSFYMAFMNNQLFVAINDYDRSVSIPFAKKITKESLDAALDFFITPAIIIDGLKLDGNKYKANGGVDSK